MDFTGKVVIITGASSGIGAACALHFAKFNALLSIIGRKEENLKRVADQCKQESGLLPLVLVADISIDKDVERIVKTTADHYGKIDVLVNNAGLVVPGSNLLNDSKNGMESYDRVLSTNLRGTYQMSSMATPYLIQTKGNIINISSVLGMKPMPSITPYCMSKAAMDMLTKCAAMELGHLGVRVNSVNPGPVKTEIFKTGYDLTAEENEKIFEGLKKATALKKISEGQDIAELVAFLASDKASCITGSSYLIDCGAMWSDTSEVL